MTLRYGLDIPKGGFVALEGEVRRHAEELALNVSDRGAVRLKQMIRQDFDKAGLKKLGNAIGATSDKKKRGTVFRRGGRVSASGAVFIRSKSERTVGAIISYTEGAQITPKKSRYLWIPTDNIQRLAGSGKDRTRMTPQIYRQRGFEQRFGKLVEIKSDNGNPLMVVQNAAQGAAGGRIKARTKTGRLRKGTVERKMLVLFIGIPRTSRAARVNPQQRAFQVMQNIDAELRGI